MMLERAVARAERRMRRADPAAAPPTAAMPHRLTTWSCRARPARPARRRSAPAEHSAPELAAAARALRQLPGAHQRCAIRWSNCCAGMLTAAVAWQFGFGCAGAAAAGGHLVPDRADRHRPGSSAAARLADAAAAVGRAARLACVWTPLRHRSLPVEPGERHRRRGASATSACGPSITLFRLLHRQGRHGLRRFQAAGRARRLARLAACCCRSCCGSATVGAIVGIALIVSGAARPRRADALRALPRRRRLARDDVGTGMGERLHRPVRPGLTIPAG